MTTNLMETAAPERDTPHEALRTVDAIAAAIEENTARQWALTQERATAHAELSSRRRERAASIAAGSDGEVPNAEIRKIQDTYDGLTSALELLEESRLALDDELAQATKREADAREDAAVAVTIAAIEQMEQAVQTFVREQFLPLDETIREHAHTARLAENAARRASAAVYGPSTSTHLPTPRSEAAWTTRRELVPLLAAFREYARHLTPTEVTP